MVLAITLTLVIVALLVDRHRTQAALLEVTRTAAEDLRGLERDYAVERSELVTRIQHPAIPIPPRPETPPPAASVVEPEEDEFDRVGTITHALPVEDAG